MKKYTNIKPTGLKGNDQINRMRGLMNLSPIKESTGNSVLELTKKGPDGKIYGIVRENHNYFIKTSDEKDNVTVTDFNYIGGLQNKTEKVYESYAKAIKQLNLKFISLNEALGKSDIINVFKNDDKLMTESWESYPEAVKSSQPDKLMGTVKSPGKNDGHEEEIISDSGETGNPDVDTPPVVEEEDVVEGEETLDETEDVELTESEKAIDRMIYEVRGETINKLSIMTAIDKINEGATSTKKKA